MPAHIEIAGANVDVSHLAPTQHLVDVPLRGGYLKKISVEIAYTNHCYSRTPRAAIGERIRPAYRVMDGRKQRVFCDRRYSLSLHLPRIMSELVRGESPVWSIPGNNFVRVELVEEESTGARATVNYYVIMRISKCVAPNEPKCIKVRVETAFPEDLLFYAKPVLKKPFSFRKLLACVWEGRDHIVSDSSVNVAKAKRSHRKANAPCKRGRSE
jgi:hypothetical protein